jgi:hypothetical protein
MMTPTDTAHGAGGLRRFAGSLLGVERSLLSVIDPPLNLDELTSNPLRTDLSRLRSIVKHAALR